MCVISKINVFAIRQSCWDTRISSEHLKLKIRCNRTNWRYLAELLLHVLSAGHIVGEVVSPRIAEFRFKVFERAIANPPQTRRRSLKFTERE